MPPPSLDVDVAIVGGGPAGLTAALYLARFHLRPLIIDAGDSRASYIPHSRNIAGFPAGVSGAALLRRMRDHARRFGARSIAATATAIVRDGEHFVITAGRQIRARRVLIATGVRNRRPRMDGAAHEAALASGRLRYCPICDGYEVTDKRVAVLGTGSHAAAETMFLRSYSADLTLIAPDGLHRIDPGDRARLAAAGVVLLDGPVADLELTDDGLAVATPDGRHLYDSLYPALGSDPGVALVAGLGARLSGTGCIKVDAHQRTSIAGLYAAGDVVAGLDQVGNAVGAAGVAATTIRNDLADATLLLRAAAP